METTTTSDMSSQRISGTVTTRSADALPAGLIVRAYDIDMKSESLLGESVPDQSGRYEIHYRTEAYAAAEAGTADVVVRVYDAARNKVAESDVHFNAPADLHIDLEVDFKVLLTEWERYISLIDSVRQGVPLPELTDKNVDFLSKELELPPDRVRMIRAAAQNAPDVLTPPELIYALERTGIGATAGELAAHDRDELAAAVKRAVEQRIVPSIDQATLDRVFARLGHVRADREPLSHVLEGANVAEIDRLTTTLATKGLRTLGDLKSPAGYKALVEAENDSLGPAANLARSHVNLSVLAPELSVRNALLGSGYRSVGDIASDDLTEFRAATKDRVDPFLATTIHTQAQLLEQLIKKTTLETRLGLTRPGHDDRDQPTETLRSAVQAEQTACECEDCESAVSPLAYLADLLKYCSDSLRDTARPTGRQQRVDYLRLEQELHQKFAELPTQCGPVEEDVHQVRIAIEVLRSHLVAHAPSAAAISTLATAERQYLRDAYEALLVRVGTSYADLRIAVVAPADEQAALADRLGLKQPTAATNHLRDLLLDVSSAPLATFEDKLEALFGLKDTRKDPLAAPPTASLLTWRRERLRDIWFDQDWPDDTPGPGILLVDPDLIGPDDFRFPVPVQTAGPFELWRRRRAWVDQTVASLLTVTAAANASRLDRMLDAMFPPAGPNPLPALPAYPLSGAAMAPARTWPNTKAALLSFANVLATGTKTAVAAAVSDLSTSYGLSVDAFQRLFVLRDKDLAAVPAGSINPPTTDAEVREFVSILTESRKRLHAADWTTEEQTAQAHTNPNLSLDFGPADFWISLTEPEVGEWPPLDDGVSPWVDPDLVKLTELPDSAVGAAARQLWTTRLQALQTYKTTQIGTARRVQFDSAFGVAFGALPTPLPPGVTTWGDFVDDTLLKLGSSVAADVTTAKTRLASQLFLTEDSFRRLMVLRAKDANTDPAEKPTAAEYDEAETILLGAYKRKSLYPTWRSDERTPPTQLADWQALKVRVPQWRGAPEDRAAWQAALRLRSKPALVDPDLTTRECLKVDPASVPVAPTNPAEAAAKLWQTRQTALSATAAAVKAARVAAAASNDQGLSAAINAAQTPPLFTRADLADLRARKAAGGAISKRLTQLGLDTDAFEYLDRIDELVSVTPPLSVDASEWDEVYSILTEAWKRRHVLEWRSAERSAQITLGPDCFTQPAPDVTQFPPPLPPDPPRWRASADRRQAWEDRLQARMDQDREIEDALDRLVDAVEEATLPELRDALIAAVPAASLPSGSSTVVPSQKPKVLGEQLLIDMETSGCAKTTRVAQAIETVQDLLFSVRGGFLHAYPSWTLTQDAAASFDVVWMWLGSYATWRAAMFVLLYPENLLVPSLRRERTPAFRKLLADLRSRGTLTGADTLSAASEFVTYLRDVSELTITAGQTVDSRFVDESQRASIAVAPSGKLPVRFLFGLAPTSNQLYWSVVSRGLHGELQSPWRLLTQFKNDVTGVIGSTVYQTPGGRRYLYVFALSSRDGEDHIGFARFDLQSEGRWSPAEAEPLEVSGETRFSKVELLDTPETVAPAVRVTTDSGVIQVQLGVKGLTSGISTTTAGTPISWSPVYQPPALAELVGRPNRIEGGFAWRRGAGGRNDLVLMILSTGLTATPAYFGEIRVILGLDAAGAPPAPLALFQPVGDLRTSYPAGVPVAAWEFGANSFGNRPVACAIAVADVDGNGKNDLIMVHVVEGSPPQMFCRLGLGLKDDGTADSWINSATSMFPSLPDNPGPCAVTFLGRQGGAFNLLFAGSGGTNRKTIWLKKITAQVQAGNITFSNPKDGPTMTAGNTVGGLGVGIADVDGDGFNDLLIQWTERDTTGQTASKLGYGRQIDADGFPTQGWSYTIDVESTLYQGGSATFLPGRSGLAVGSLMGAPGRIDAIIASFPAPVTPRSEEWRYIVANDLNLHLSPGSGQVIPTGQYKPFLVSPLVPQTYDYRVGADRTYAPSLIQVWNKNSGKTRINQTLVTEAFFFVPLAIALQLQRSGDYLAALDWFRSIYDYSLPSTSREIYPGLEPNPSPDVWRDDHWMWLQDPLDPHAIAEGRTGTYKRFIIQATSRAFLDYADAEFTRDTSESITLARTLYLEALDLLDESDLKQTYNGCDLVREWIFFVVGELADSMDEQTKDDIYTLAHEGRPDTLNGLSSTLKTAYTAGAMTADAKAEIHSAALALGSAPQGPRTLDELFSLQRRTDARLTQAFLSDSRYMPETMGITVGAAQAIDNVFTETFGSSYKPGMFQTAVGYNGLPEQARELVWGGGYTDPGPDTIGDFFGSFIGGLGIEGFATPLPPLGPGIGVVPGDRPFPPLPPPSGPGFLTIQACVPPNPVLRALRLRADLNLYKIRTCRSITGERRQVEPYAAATDTSTGMPSIGAGGQLVVPGIANLAPTPYRFTVLVERAKSLVQLAQQTENAMLAAIQAGDAERYNVLKARQDLDNARANVKLQTLRVTEAQSGITLTQLQRDKAQLEVDQYNDWLQAGISAFEETAVGAMWVAFGLEAGLAASYATAAVVAAATGVGAAKAAEFAASAAQSGAQASAQLAQIYQFWASYDEKRQNWVFQRNLAQQDRKIADQQYYLAQDQLRVVTQEQTIASLNESHASSTIEFLAQKFTNTDLYDWMADVLQGVYRYFLQQATGTARLAAAQLAFERQEAPPPFIQSDYWQPSSDDGASANGATPDRRGLTGAARLLQDLTQLDQYAFTTDRRKLQLSKTISIAQLAPLEFQQFRETGVLTFATPMDLFDRDFPGQYLRLVHRVRVSMLALTPPSLGIRATLTANRISRAVIGGDLFQTVRVSHGPDMVALSSPRDATGLFDLDVQPTMLAPFENIGVSTTWELRMPRAANPFDFSTIADVFLTIDYTALHSFDYQQQVLARLGRRVSARRGWSFRYQFADQWYELNNPDLSTTPMRVLFETAAGDFPPNLDAGSLAVEDIALHFVRRNGSRFEISPVALRFREQGSAVYVGGSASTIDGTISTAAGSAGSWMTMQARAPIGQWELSLPDNEEMRGRFQAGDIVDVMLVLTYSGRLPAWPD